MTLGELIKDKNLPLRVQQGGPKGLYKDYFFEAHSFDGAVVKGYISDSRGNLYLIRHWAHSSGWELYTPNANDKKVTTVDAMCECGKDKHGFAMHSSWCPKHNT